MSDYDLTALSQAYIHSFRERNVPRCVGFFADDATIAFLSENFTGSAAIKRWHQARFDADLEILEASEPVVDESRVDVDVVITSQVLRDWTMPRVGGRIIMEFSEGKVVAMGFQMLSAGGETYAWNP